jgi:hypothetical protein
MRRALATALAVPALLLTACDDGGEVAETPTATTDPAPATEAAPTTDAAEQTADDSALTTDTAPTTDAPTDDAAVTSAAPGDVEGGEDGQAAADVAKQFFLASIKALPEACDHLVSFTDPEVPMVEMESDLELCREILPAAMAADVESQGLSTEEQVAVLDAMQITGAEVDGDVAVVDRDNLSPLFQDALGDEVITLLRIDDQWYVDLDRSFQPSDR